MSLPLTLKSPVAEEYQAIFSNEALTFVAELEEKFGSKIDDQLKNRESIMNDLRAGKRFDFLAETKHIRDGDWEVDPIPADLQDRRVEITGPADRKMIINALNSGAKVFMACLEDALTPSWGKLLDAQASLYDAVRGTLEYTSSEGKKYKLNGDYPSDDLAIMIVRPRGFHLSEKHVLLDEKPIHGSLLDFGLYFFHNAEELIKRGTAPYFYLPKLESWQEAKIWDDIFVFAQEKFGIKVGTIKATVLIETFPAAFQMDEILHAMKHHIVGQNAGRWDYIFSYIKKHSHVKRFVCPDRAQINMVQPFMRAYSLLLIQTCHKRGAHAMGGMSAFIPIKGDEAANDLAIQSVKNDKKREAQDGHDGTWVAHPALIAVAKQIFDQYMPEPNQVDVQLDHWEVGKDELLEVPRGKITEDGLRNNINVCLQYIANWLQGTGCVPIFNLMEDAATAEIARTQIWQWIKHEAHLGKVPQSNDGEGEKITAELFLRYRDEELKKIHKSLGDEVFKSLPFVKAYKLLEKLVLAEELEEFLTIPAYSQVD